MLDDHVRLVSVQNNKEVGDTMMYRTDKPVKAPRPLGLPASCSVTFISDSVISPTWPMGALLLLDRESSLRETILADSYTTLRNKWNNQT